MTVTADDVLGALEQVMVDHLGETLDLMNDARDTAYPMPDPATWNQYDDPDSLAPTHVPTLNFSSPGLAEGFTKDAAGYTGTWICVVTVFARDPGGVNTERATASAVRFYAAAIRDTALRHGTLDGLADGLDCTGEEYAVFDTAVAKSFGAGFVELEVTVPNAVVLGPASGANPIGLPAGAFTALTTDVTVSPMED